MRQRGMVGIARVVLFGKERMIMIEPRSKGMVGTSANCARTTYRRVERRARCEGRELATFRPIASDAFRIWMETGRLPPSLDEPHDTGPGRGPSEH